MSQEPFIADCPHCDKDEWRDEDDWFEHVSCCEWEQQQDELARED